MATKQTFKAFDPLDMVSRNIDRVLQIEEKAQKDRSLAEAASETIGEFVGTFWFVLIHLSLVAGWMTINSSACHNQRPWDPYPFNMLSTIASIEAVILSAFVLMKQNRMSHIGDRRAHLDLQVNLLTEQETSMVIQMLDRVSRKLEIDPEAQEAAVQLSRVASLEHLVHELHRRFPGVQSDLPPQPDAAPVGGRDPPSAG